MIEGAAIRMVALKRLVIGAGTGTALGLALASGAGAQGENPAPTVTVARAENACFNDLVPFMGTVVAREEIMVYPDVEQARVTEVLADEGDRVQNTQTLAKVIRANPSGQGAQVLDVRAPADGVILKRSAYVGAPVAGGGPEPMFRMARGGDVEIEADLPQPRLAKVAPGYVARVQMPGGEELSGSVRLVSAELDRQTRLGRVRITVPADERLVFGSTLPGVIETGRSCGLAVPVSALVTRGDATFVQRVQRGKVETRPVRLGLVEGARVEIEDGLAEGDLVVARAGTFLRDGDAVRPVELPAKPAEPPPKAAEAPIKFDYQPKPFEPPAEADETSPEANETSPGAAAGEPRR